MAEQLAKNYRNAWAKRKKLELESKGTIPWYQQTFYISSSPVLSGSTEQLPKLQCIQPISILRRGWPFNVCTL